MNITTEKSELIAYRLIRIETNRFDRNKNDSELGNYVRGVVDFQTEIFSKIQDELALNDMVEKCKQQLKGESNG